VRLKVTLTTRQVCIKSWPSQVLSLDADIQWRRTSTAKRQHSGPVAG